MEVSSRLRRKHGPGIRDARLGSYGRSGDLEAKVSHQRTNPVGELNPCFGNRGGMRLRIELTSAGFWRGEDLMKRLASRLTWWHNAPQESPAVNAAARRGQPWTMLASTCTRESQIYVLAEGGEVIALTKPCSVPADMSGRERPILEWCAVPGS
jgi:hypothetical protein